MCFSGPTGVTSSWVCWAEQRILLSHALQGCYNLCGPFQPVVLIFTSKSQQKGCKLWLPKDLLKLIHLPMESRSNNTMPTMGDLLSTYSSITVTNRVRRYPFVESVHTSKMALLQEGLRISLKGPERPCYTPFTGGPQQSQSTCGHMHFATSMRSTTPLLP
jgi:hypothetical protein